MIKRIIFGTIMAIALIGVFAADWYLTSDYVDGSSGIVASGCADGCASMSSGCGLWKNPLVRVVPISCLILLLACMGFFEIRRLLISAGFRPLIFSGLFGTLLIALHPLWSARLGMCLPIGSGSEVFGNFALLLGVILAIIFIEQMARFRTADAISRISGTLIIVVYLGVCISIALQIRTQFGLAAFVMFLCAAKFTDVFAYFTGSLLGKHKLIPWLSPGKSWEGLAGGIAAAVGICVLLSFLMGKFQLVSRWSLDGGLPTMLQCAIFGFIVAIVGQFADLCESLLKRSAEVKDSGKLIPNFGGIMDVIDSPLLSAPAALICLEIFQIVAPSV